MYMQLHNLNPSTTGDVMLLVRVPGFSLSTHMTANSGSVNCSCTWQPGWERKVSAGPYLRVYSDIMYTGQRERGMVVCMALLCCSS